MTHPSVSYTDVMVLKKMFLRLAALLHFAKFVSCYVLCLCHLVYTQYPEKLLHSQMPHLLV